MPLRNLRALRPLLGAVVCATAALGSLSAEAQTSIPTGRLLASNCFQCHGTNGKGPGFDKLAGESAAEIYRELLKFRSGQEGTGIMARHSLGYTDQQMRDIAAYLSTQKK